MFEKNTLYYGDNLVVLKKFSDSCIDLIYLDPPFNSGANYNILFKEQSGIQSQSQIQAFTDFWKWDKVAEDTFVELQKGEGKIRDMVQALKQLFGKKSDALAYLVMMTVRLIELKRVLKDTGSIYLHCDPTASHYLKIVMDTVFGGENFQNEIIWCYAGGGVPKMAFARKHDVIFFYSKTQSNRRVFNVQTKPYGLMGSNKKWKRADGSDLLREGKHMEDWWIDINPILPLHRAMFGNSAEYLGYQTQKPVTLLERIIKTSSNEGDIILDPFCGCGTTIEASQKLGRKWIGIDITHLAIALIKSRLTKIRCTPNKDYIIKGEPADFESAKQLAFQDKYQFQYWAGSLLQGFYPIEQSDKNPYGKKGADKGVDGWLTFEEADRTVQKIAVQVKSGGVGASTIRDLIGTVNNTGSAMGILITLEEPTIPMKQAIFEAGYFKTETVGMDIQYPKIQIATIKDLMDGIKLKLPPIKR